MAQFRVVLDQIELDEKQHRQLDKALQRATLQFLAELDFGGDRVAFVSPRILRPPLAGIWIRKVEDLGFLKEGLHESVQRLNEEIQQGVDF
ncbi:MAG TPA: hypothetical protein VF715_06575 [Thermoleophilaceae bacterium]|jgi:hypothetical protein